MIKTFDGTYCVIHNNRFKILDYFTFRKFDSEQVVHFIGTYKECLGFIARSNAAQELIDSANREHENYELITAQEALNELEDMETYTREEVRLIAINSINSVLSYIFKGKNFDVNQVVNSEIDTIKLF